MSASVTNSAKSDSPATTGPAIRSRAEASKLAKLPRAEAIVERKSRATSEATASVASSSDSTVTLQAESLTAAIPEVEDQPPASHGSPLVAAGLWLYHLRSALYAGTGSATVHMVALISLAILFPEPPRLHRVPIKFALQAEVQPEPVRPEPPELLQDVKIQVESRVLSVVPVSMETAKGFGSIGSGGGRGGGNSGGTADAGLDSGPVSLASGGTGFGIDDAYGTHMLGEVGEKADYSATFFGIKAEGKRFVFVVDTSGSMRINERYLRCRNELWKSISAMKYGQQYFIMFFNHDVYGMPENKLVDARPAQLKRTGQWMLTAEPNGGTDPWPGLERAFRIKPDAIYLLTDGEFDPEVVQRVNRIQPETKKKIPVHTIAFQSLRGAELLKIISHVSGGQHTYVP